MNAHEKEFHRDDEQIKAAIWGPKRSEAQGGGRRTERGIEERMNLQEKIARRKSTRVSNPDKLLIAVVVATVTKLLDVFL